MRAGSRQRRVRFEKRSDTQDTGGGVDRVWNLLCDERCQIERIQSFIRDIERLNAGGIVAQPTVRIHVLKNPLTDQIDGTCRATDLDNGEEFNVDISSDIEGLNRNLVITATQNKPS